MATQTARKGRTVTVEIPAEGCNEWKKQEIQAGFADLDVGEYVPNEEVVKWLRSWGSEHELQPPL